MNEIYVKNILKDEARVWRIGIILIKNVTRE